MKCGILEAEEQSSYQLCYSLDVEVFIFLNNGLRYLFKFVQPPVFAPYLLLLLLLSPLVRSIATHFPQREGAQGTALAC